METQFPTVDSFCFSRNYRRPCHGLDGAKLRPRRRGSVRFFISRPSSHRWPRLLVLSGQIPLAVQPVIRLSALGHSLADVEAMAVSDRGILSFCRALGSPQTLALVVRGFAHCRHKPLTNAW